MGGCSHCSMPTVMLERCPLKCGMWHHAGSRVAPPRPWFSSRFRRAIEESGIRPGFCWPPPPSPPSPSPSPPSCRHLRLHRPLGRRRCCPWPSGRQRVGAAAGETAVCAVQSRANLGGGMFGMFGHAPMFSNGSALSARSRSWALTEDRQRQAEYARFPCLSGRECRVSLLPFA